ncbi:Ras-related protein Rab-28 [Polyrhizophydium stewartii]|uniref:Ras-related protein Rab-28 n=1 Tax=Polyrhizophydium stewartii TaxID=2732419 RepID=A0ABR4N1X5_9FUNG|nr:Ras- protein Rab-28 [Polyrhizophydium stewartii]
MASFVGLNSSSQPSLRFEDAELETKLDPIVHVVLVGEGGVGKSTMCEALVGGVGAASTLATKYKQTIGLYIHETKLWLPNKLNKVELRVWDVGGHTLRNKLATNYLFYADAILFVYDITHVGSFSTLTTWLKRVRATFDVEDAAQPGVRDRRLPFLGLIANKCDLEYMRTVEQERHDSFAKLNNFHMDMFLSALSPEDVMQCFLKVASQVTGVRLVSRHDQAIVSRISTRRTTRMLLKPSQAIDEEEDGATQQEEGGARQCLLL